jgi:hypothetical protein
VRVAWGGIGLVSNSHAIRLKIWDLTSYDRQPRRKD